MELRVGHRRLASVAEFPEGNADAALPCVDVTWRDATSVSVEVAHEHRAHDASAMVAALAAALRRAYGEGAEYAVARVAANDAVSARALLRVGFEPELVGPGHEQAWERLLAAESRPPSLL